MTDHFVFLDFGSFEIYWFGFLVGCAVFIASLIYCRMRRMQGEDASEALVTAILAIPSAFVLARLSYCWFRKASFYGRASEYFSLTYGGYALHGAIAAILIVLLIRSRMSKKSIIKMLDAAAPALSVAIAIGRFAGRTSGEEGGYEINTAYELPFLMWSEADQAKLLWVGFFEGIFAVIIAAVTFVLFYQKYRLHRAGLREGCVTLAFMLTYGLSQAFLESLRGDSLFMITLGFVRIDQIIAIVMAVAAIVVIIVENYRLKGLSLGSVMRWLICASALTVAVICEFTLNTTYMVLIYACMFLELTVMWIVAARIFHESVRIRARKNTDSKSRPAMQA